MSCVCGLFVAATLERGWRWTEGRCVWLLGAPGVRLSLQRQMATQSSAGDDVVICSQEQEKMSSIFQRTDENLEESLATKSLGSSFLWMATAWIKHE